MKTIKIFLASSEELSPEREKMADLVLHLNKLFKGRGIELDLEKWEYLDASMSGKRKQDEYNDVLHQCDICMVLFWRRFGSYTGEELDVAYKSMLDGGNPQKIYVFFKNPNSEDVSQEVRDFITEYEKRYGGHFFCKFHTVDTMKLEFLLQLENYQKDMLGEKTIEVRNEHVFVDNEALVDLNNVPFAANNEGFKKRQAELKKLREEITDIQANLEKKQRKLERKKADYEENPDDEDCLEDYQDAKEDVDKLTDDLQKKLDCKNALEDEFEREQQNLFNTARRITEQRGRKISERMTRAIEAFESGDAQRADIILDEAEKDFDEARKDFRMTKKVSVQALEEQIQRASYKMSNNFIPIEERLAKTLQIYEEADAFAQEINYDQKKYLDFLWDYSAFLYDHAHYEKAIEIYNRQIKMCEDFYGKEHPDTAGSYNNIGAVYCDLGNYDKALEYQKRALEIREKVYGKEHPETASIYGNIGVVYDCFGNYDKALEYHKRALEIQEKVLGKEHSDTAISCGNIGVVYGILGNYDKALVYHKQALEIREKVLGKEHPETASSYNNIGIVYDCFGNYDKALEYHKQALDIQEKVMGKEHPDTALSYGNIGNVFFRLGNYDKALEYYNQALVIQEKVLGKKHPETARLYINIGLAYKNLGNYDKALEQFELCLKLQKEQNIPEGSIHETEEKIVSLKELKKNGRLSEQ
ncbi:Tfp pilus assembly protein PilF [Prevotella sp. khp1]|uniref:tetratricopeptide repeat protein n=1 Tax=Prevotellaceae TaxID=171552 RepID=UPI00089036F0|nr:MULTISPECIES: tetratricopeptide repeat protein [Prevotellaceae]QVJ81661.1 tetratricopeptide repeat protein [Xylanibacter ruminicola]SDQ55656.1 Tfp pilus assembly protein PilF [Prevotella sp. khp1]